MVIEYYGVRRSQVDTETASAGTQQEDEDIRSEYGVSDRDG